MAMQAGGACLPQRRRQSDVPRCWPSPFLVRGVHNLEAESKNTTLGTLRNKGEYVHQSKGLSQTEYILDFTISEIHGQSIFLGLGSAQSISRGCNKWGKLPCNEYEIA